IASQAKFEGRGALLPAEPCFGIKHGPGGNAGYYFFNLDTLTVCRKTKLCVVRDSYLTPCGMLRHVALTTLALNMTSIWIRLCGVVALALIIFASLMLPAKWQQLRTGHWAVEHFLAYFAATLIVCLGWRHPFVVAGMLILLAALLEVL